MALRAVVFLVLLLIPIGAQQAFATLIDFDTYPDGTVPASLDKITTEYETCGVREFTTTDPGGPQINNSPISGKSPPNDLFGSGGTNPFRQPIGINFVSPVESVSIKALGVGCAALIVDAYNSADVLIQTKSVPADFATGGGSGKGNVDVVSISVPDITRLEIRQPDPEFKCGGVIDGYTIDDLMFPGPVCEFQETQVIGGKIIPLETTALLIAGMQTSYFILTALVTLGAGTFSALYYISKRK